jgi:hypothetical protein
MQGDRGDVILGWLIKVSLVIGLLGLCLFDAVSVAVTNMNAQDTAGTAAGIGADEWTSSHNLQSAYNAASAFAEEHGGSVGPKDFWIDPDGTVHVRMVKDATTILLYRNSTTKKWAHVVANGSRRAA